MVSFFGQRQVPEEKEHFSTYAFDSKTGAARWKHEPGDYETERISREVLILSTSSAKGYLLSKLSEKTNTKSVLIKSRNGYEGDLISVFNKNWNPDPSSQ